MHFQVEVASCCERLLSIEEKEHRRGKNRMRRKTEVWQKQQGRKVSVIVKSARGECHSTVCLGIMSKEHI